MNAAIFVPILLAIIDYAPQLSRGLRDVADGIRDLWREGREPTAAELDALFRRATDAGVDLRGVVRARLAPGGDWHGRADELPPETT